MSTKLLHDPDLIVARILWANLGFGSDPAPWETYYQKKGTRPTGAWPVFNGQEPETEPDNVLTVYETTPQFDARIMVTGENQQHYGFTVRVRGKNRATAKQKARDIEHYFNESFLDQQVTIDAQQYLVPSIARTTLIDIGQMPVHPMLWLVNLNCLCNILAYPL